jgi:multicomponent Na+:H+ antiporter subunit C
MLTLLAIVIGALYAMGLYMMLRRSMVKLIIGLALLGHAANLLIFVAASGHGLVRGGPPILAEGEIRPTEIFADPVPQALILTAIVIGFGVLAFALVLFHRTYRSIGTDDMHAMTTTER